MQETINLSCFQVVFAYLAMLTAVTFSFSKNKLLYKKALAIVVQIGLTGFLPLSIFKAPYYPLQLINTLLYMSTTSLNAIYLARGLA